MAGKGKKGGQEVSKKTENKMKAKIVEDKTFGLKNKNKSTKVQNYVKSVTHQVMAGNSKGGLAAQESKSFQEKKDKKKKDEASALLASLFKNAQNLANNKAPVASENQPINMYADPRQGTVDMPETIITCKFFLDAVEDEKYGWRWECPNGSKCQYRHMLPEGYVLLTKKQRDAEKQRQKDNVETRSIEEIIEEERAALKYDDLTPVTKESFFAWKARKAEKKQKELEEKMKAEEAKATKNKGGKGKQSVMNGRALFTYNPDMFKDDENAVEEIVFEEDGDNQQEESKIQDGGGRLVKEEAKEESAAVDENLFAAEADNVEEDVDFD